MARGSRPEQVNCSWVRSRSLEPCVRPGSLHDQIVKHWDFIRSYIIKNDHLFLSLMADGGIYEFEPIGG